MQRPCSTREALVGLLHESPGLGPTDAARALGVDRTTVQYHLRRLVRDGLAVTGETAAGLRYFRAGALPPERRGAHPVAREAALLLDALRGSPGCTQSGLARALGVPRPTLAWRIGKLRRAGLVLAQRHGKEVRLHARPAEAAGAGRAEESL